MLFGGRSPEHDVSVVTGLQAIKAIDAERFSAFPVYVTTGGGWLVGEKLLDQRNYVPQGPILDELEEVTLDVRPNVDGIGRLLSTKKRGLFGSSKPIEFDVALFAFHGSFGEDGRMQSLFEIANVPYTGMRPSSSAISMDKVATKQALANTGVETLPSIVIRRSKSGFFPSEAEIASSLSGVSFPVIVKPVHLGSSIGVAKATSVAEVRASLPPIFKLDNSALIEPVVPNLTEYNVAIRRGENDVLCSAIERPKAASELLDFKAKYWSSGGAKTGNKIPGSTNQGMLNLTREINPKLDSGLENRIRDWAKICFKALDANGVPRIDFLCNASTGDLWLNEVNPCPGSFGYFLWEAAEQPILFTDLLSSLIQEAFDLHRSSQMPSDPTQPDARLFKHP